jgi:GxxExxY protein
VRTNTLVQAVKTSYSYNKKQPMTENEISKIIVEEAIHIHRSVGPGMLESVYVHCLYHRLIKRGLKVKKEVPVPVVFEQVKLECGYRVDIIVEDKVLIEAKSIEAIAPIHSSQTLTYLRFLGLKLGMLLNFNCVLMKDGIRRVVNNL